ncbi:hypothetical protein lerEdw1_006164 [Lerista edwardsae]|nr:hypothetical protein lerEdw1_006164 [Lerista edwardsae]
MCKLPEIRAMLRLSRRRLQRKNTTSQITDDVSFYHPPPDGGWGWVVVLASIVLSMFVSGFHSAFGVYMLSLLQTFKSSNSAVAWIGSVSYAFIMIFGPVSGKLLLKYGAIKVAIIGVLIVIAGVLSSSYAPDIRVLFFTYGIIVGVGSSLATTPGMIMVSLYFTSKRSFATGIVMAGWAAATFVQNKLHQHLIQAFGWRISLRIYSGILTICIFAGFAFKPLQKHRAHPSVVDKFQTSPLKGFIVDLSLWKDRIFEVWVCSLGFAKFGFFIPFVHMIKHAGDLGISVDKASYIMVGLGLSSMVSCLLFGRICDIENINRLSLNQAAILASGVVYFIIPFCKTFPALVAICSVLGFFDSGNYVLLPVLTFDLMGAEKMTVAWGFMMAINSISCFGPPFAGWMYDIYGNYNIGFIVTGICNITAASILGCIPWLQRTATQAKKNYLNASVCEMSNTIVSWRSQSPSLGSLSSSNVDLTVDLEESLSEHSKRVSVSVKSILKADTTSFRSVSGSISARKKEDGVAFLQVEAPASDLDRPGDELTKLETASSRSETSVSVKSISPHRKGDGMTFLDVDSHLPEHAESSIELRPVDELAKSEASAFKSETPVSAKQTEYVAPHRKEDGVAFVGVKDSDSDQEVVFESATDLTVIEDQAKSGKVPFTSRSTKQTVPIPHRKEDGVAFLGVEDSETDQDEVFESATDLTVMEEQAKSGKVSFKRETSRSTKQTVPIPHRKGVAFLDVEDSQSEQEELSENATDLKPVDNLVKSEATPVESETSESVKESGLNLHRNKSRLVLADAEDDKEKSTQQI